MNLTLPAIVAASGLSARMGRSKPLLDARGRTFIARILDALREGGAEPSIVVVRDPDGPEGMEAAAEGGVVIGNPDPTPGPISSLQAGIRALPSGAPGTLFCPADHPLFRGRTVQTLRAAFFEEGGLFIAPTWEGRRGHPVVFHSKLFRELLEEGLPEGARTVIRRYLEHRVEVPVDDPGVLADIDTPDDYRRHFRP